jgi:hypothetical protein
MSETTHKTYACATCELRRKAEASPKTVMARIWKFHTKFCPGWKAYQAHLASEKPGPATS